MNYRFAYIIVLLVGTRSHEHHKTTRVIGFVDSVK